MTKHANGLKRIKEILGNNATEVVVEHFKKISPDFSNYIVEFAYGDFYTRTTLPDKSKEIAAVACLIGQGNTGFAVKAHLKGMLNVGWTKNEIIELLIFLLVYTGFPAIVETIDIAHEVFKDYDKK